MGGGILELVSSGPQDKFLFENEPKTSPFNITYKKPGNFAIDTKKVYFDGPFDFNTRSVATIPHNGDLLTNLFIEAQLPQMTPSRTNVSWTNSIGHALFQKIELLIGNVVIDTHYGEWYEIWSELMNKSSRKDAYNTMVGKFPVGIPPSVMNQTAYTIYLPLKFWFCEEYELALPLIALYNDEIKVAVYTRKFDELWVSDDGNPPTGKYTISQGFLYADYIYLDKSERKLFAENKHSFIVKQLQLNEMNYINPNFTNVKIPFEFNHPVTELIWTIQRSDIGDKGEDKGNDWFNYSDSITIIRNDPLVRGKIIFSSADRTEYHHSNFYRLLQPYRYHSRTPDNFIYNYSFSLKPEDPQSYGSCNFSQITGAELHIQIKENHPGSTVKLWAINFNILSIKNGLGFIKFSA